MTLYESLLDDLRHARRQMVAHFGKPEHSQYRTIVRYLENEIKALTVSNTISA